MKTLGRICVVACAVVAINGGVEAATTTRVASGLSRPVYVTAAPQDYDRIFIVEQWTARIRILHLDSQTTETFLNIDSLVIGTGNER